MVQVPVCVALALLNQGTSSIVLDLGTSILLKAMGRTSGKWQQFGFGTLEYIRTGCVAKLGTTTEKRGHPAEVLTNLSIVYTSCMLEGERCARKIKKKDGKMKPALNTEPGTRKV